MAKKVLAVIILVLMILVASGGNSQARAEDSSVEIFRILFPEAMQEGMFHAAADTKAARMAYRVKSTSTNVYTGGKFSAIKLNGLELPDPQDIKMEAEWSYVAVYIGLDWENYSKLEAGISLRNKDLMGGDGSHPGWHAFVNYTPQKTNEPFNDPTLVEIQRSRTPIEGSTFTLELRIGEVEQVGDSYRWKAYFYVNGEPIEVKRTDKETQEEYTQDWWPLYGSTGNHNPNQFDPKVVVSTWMATGREDEVEYGPVKINYVQAGWTEESGDLTYMPLMPGLLTEGDAGIEIETIYNGNNNDIMDREYAVEFQEDKFVYTVGLPPVSMADRLNSIARRYGLRNNDNGSESHPDWNARYDLTGDGKIDLFDIVTAVR